MELRIFQKGFNYSQDGPGNRLVYHLQGCNMRCAWCANPEGMNFQGGKAVDTEDILQEVQRSRSMFFDGGGVTFTGGEPTMQFEALSLLLKRLKELNVHTAIETNGTHPRFPELFDHLDSIMMDLKQPFAEKHRQFTGVALDTVLRNITLAAEVGKDLLIRIPLINGYNTDKEDIVAFATFLRGLNQENLRIELLRYHEYGRVKWERLNRSYEVENGFVSDDQYRMFHDLLTEYGPKLVKT